jgi:hypothetical protein
MKTNKFLLKSMIALSSVAFMTSCSSDDGPSLPPIGGYNSADEIAATDLVAYWPLNGNGVESKSNTSPSNTVGVTYEMGVKGEGAKLMNGFLSYPEIASMATSMSSMSISCWAKVNNNGASATMMFSLSRPDAFAGNINLMAETGWQPATSDSLTVKGYVQIKGADGISVNGQDTRNTIKENAESIAAGNIPFANKNGGKWAHYVITWDATNAHFKVYANGVKISNPEWERRNKIDGIDQPLGLNFFTPTKPILGASATVAAGSPLDTWDKAMTGSIDEVRVYKKVLIPADVNALYELELAGR